MRYGLEVVVTQGEVVHVVLCHVSLLSVSWCHNRVPHSGATFPKRLKETLGVKSTSTIYLLKDCFIYSSCRKEVNTEVRICVMLLY